MIAYKDEKANKPFCKEFGNLSCSLFCFYLSLKNFVYKVFKCSKN